MDDLKNNVKKFVARHEIPILWKWGSGFWNFNTKQQINIDHENKYIFIHIPKTAGTSVRHALHQAQFSHQSKGTRLAFHKHTPALTIKRNISKSIWNSHFKFAFVRNPWDLMVSSYYWWLRKGKRYSKSIAQKAIQVEQCRDFREFILSDFGSTHINELEARDLSHWICDENGEIIVDFVGKVENLQQDLEYVFNQLGASCPKVKVSNASQRDTYQKYYDRETKEAIANRFQWTIETFDYEF